MELLIGKDFPKKINPIIDATKSKIRIVMFDWRWYPNDPGCSCQLFNQNLLRAFRRGVDIKAITNFPSIAKTLEALGIQAKTLSTKTLVHSKFIVFDDYFFVLGSHNLTENAFSSNFETSLFSDDKNIANILTNSFDKLWLL